MAFTDDDLKRLKKGIESREDSIERDDALALLARLEGDESLLDRLIERMKLINGPVEKCVYYDTDTHTCPNHMLITEAEAWRKAAKK